jgi:transcriptional regulator with XRE-family HTH domain
VNLVRHGTIVATFEQYVRRSTLATLRLTRDSDCRTLFTNSNDLDRIATMKEQRVVDVGGLYEALDLKRRNDDLSWREAAAKMGVSPSTLTRMAQGASPDVEGFGKMVQWLGVSADDFIARTKGRTSRKSEELLVVVSRHLRASKELDAKSAKALETIIEAAYRQVKDLKGR